MIQLLNFPEPTECNNRDVSHTPFCITFFSWLVARIVWGLQQTWLNLSKRTIWDHGTNIILWWSSFFLQAFVGTDLVSSGGVSLATFFNLLSYSTAFISVWRICFLLKCLNKYSLLQHCHSPTKCLQNICGFPKTFLNCWWSPMISRKMHTTVTSQIPWTYENRDHQQQFWNMNRHCQAAGKIKPNQHFLLLEEGTIYWACWIFFCYLSPYGIKWERQGPVPHFYHYRILCLLYRWLQKLVPNFLRSLSAPSDFSYHYTT